MQPCCTNKFQFHRVKEYVDVQSEDKDDEPFVDEGSFDERHCLVHSRDVIPNEWPRSGEIEFRNVTVRYEDGPNILTDINLKFKAGERVAIIGRTGSGKTTVSLERKFRCPMAY
jgi:ABC-type multidrug transport system fused ATPase/permease subunit